MEKFDLEKYWDFRVWVKSQIAQLRALLSEYQQNGGGGGTGGGGDFDPNGTYPNVTVGNATKAVSATTANTANRATTADKATTADSATHAGSAERATIAINLQNAPELTTENEQIVVKAGGKSSNALTVPYAQRADFATDLSGRVEATPEVFTYRPSAGDKSIKDDNAFIRRVKGNSVVWNQFVAQYNRTNNGVTISFNNDIYNLSGIASDNYFNIAYITDIPKGHMFLIFCKVLANPNNISFGFGDLNNGSNFNPAETNYFLYTVKENTLANHAIGCQSYSAGTDFTGVKLACNVHDLTAMFGAGNEPTTVEEFRALYPDSYYPYNAGELRNLVYSGIKTVGFNEFNGTYARVLPNESYYLGGSYTSIGFTKELGGATETISIPSNRIYTPTQLGYIYATGTDICINLHHTGYRDGEYEPYKEVTHSLPLSKITNGEPLRKAGSVYDEINETEYIRRVGVRAYTAGDEQDETLMTDRAYTNYPLDEPIVKPIEIPIDFNYYVEDFGTEEAMLAENSAPFSADIIYQFNATDQVRNNSRNIQRLKKTAFNPSGSTTQYIRGDGSYGDVSELSQPIQINDGEMDSPDSSEYDYEFRLFHQHYAKSRVELNDESKVLIRINAPENADIVAEYWFELRVGESLPNLTFENPNNVDSIFRIGGQVQEYAVNIWHIISTDGGATYFGEIKNYITE